MGTMRVHGGAPLTNRGAGMLWPWSRTDTGGNTAWPVWSPQDVRLLSTLKAQSDASSDHERALRMPPRWPEHRTKYGIARARPIGSGCAMYGGRSCGFPQHPARNDMDDAPPAGPPVQGPTGARSRACAHACKEETPGVCPGLPVHRSRDIMVPSRSGEPVPDRIGDGRGP